MRRGGPDRSFVGGRKERARKRPKLDRSRAGLRGVEVRPPLILHP